MCLVVSFPPLKPAKIWLLNCLDLVKLVRCNVVVLLVPFPLMRLMGRSMANVLLPRKLLSLLTILRMRSVQLLTLAVTCYMFLLANVWRMLVVSLGRMTWCPRRCTPGYGLGKNAYILVTELLMVVPNSLGVPTRVTCRPPRPRPLVSSSARVMFGLQILRVRKPMLGWVVVVVMMPLFRLELTLMTRGPAPFYALWTQVRLNMKFLCMLRDFLFVPTPSRHALVQVL